MFIMFVSFVLGVPTLSRIESVTWYTIILCGMQWGMDSKVFLVFHLKTFVCICFSIRFKRGTFRGYLLGKEIFVIIE